MSNEAKKNFIKATDVLKDAVCGYLDAFAAVVESTPEITEATLVAAEEATAPFKEAPAEKKSKKSAKKSKPEPVEEPESDDEETVTGHISAEDLEEMSYNDLKKLAADMGIPAKGDRNTLIKKITAADVEVPTDGGDDDDEEEEKPKKSKKSADKPEKKSKKKPDPEPEEDDDDTDDEDDEPADNIEESVRAMCEDMGVEDIASVLADAGLSTKGKRQALIDRVVKGVKDGLIDIDDDDEDDEPDEDDGEYDDEADEYELNDPENPDMTDERREAILALEKKIKKSIKSGKLTTAKMKKALKDFYAADKEALKVIKDGDDEVIEELYLDMKFNYIDDDGDSHDDEEAYYINEIPFCCGTPLDYDEEDEVYSCSRCGESYPVGGDEDDDEDDE